MMMAREGLLRLRGALGHLRHGRAWERLRIASRGYLWRRREASRRGEGSERDSFETTLQPGVRLRLYLDSKLSEYIYVLDFEASERRFLNSFLRPGDVFVDVGANIGLFTVVAARAVGDRGRVYAFEPCAKTYERLCANIRLNDFTNVAAFGLALSDTATERSMVASMDGFDAWNSLAPPSIEGTFETETVRCVRWDDFAHEHGLVGLVTMMKIDVEGWETRVLTGGSTTLSREDAPILQVEFTEENCRAAGTRCADLYRALEELGYKMFIYDDTVGRLRPDPLREDYPYLNLIAVKHIEQVRARLEGAMRSRWGLPFLRLAGNPGLTSGS